MSFMRRTLYLISRGRLNGVWSQVVTGATILFQGHQEAHQIIDILGAQAFGDV